LTLLLEQSTIVVESEDKNMNQWRKDFTKLDKVAQNTVIAITEDGIVRVASPSGNVYSVNPKNDTCTCKEGQKAMEENRPSRCTHLQAAKVA